MPPKGRANGIAAASSKAGPSSNTTTSAASKRKRPVAQVSSPPAQASSSNLPTRDVISATQDAGLEVPSDDDQEDDEGDDSDVEEFPEIDARSSDEEDDDEDAESYDVSSSDFEDADVEEDPTDTEDTDDYDDDQEEADANEFSSKSTTQAQIDSQLDKMVKRATIKPNEEDYKLNKIGLDPSQAATLPADRNKYQGKFSTSKITGHPIRVYPEIEPEYDSDSSTEDAPNRIGDVPLEWYDDLPHIGYDVDGRKVMRPAKGDELDKFLATVEDPESWTAVEDKLMGQDVKLSAEELDIIRRLQNAEIPDGSYDPYEDQVHWFTGEGKQMVMPMSGKPEPKRRFVPSKWEHKKVMKIVRAIRQGRITPKAPAQTKASIYNIWSDADTPAVDHPMHLQAPKLPPPTTAESYNPPAEYLFNDEERKAWEDAEREDRKTNYLPAKHSSLRVVPGYKDFMQERFERCLDLYMAPRVRRKRLDITDPDQLLPKLPSPQELRPFPTTCAVTYTHPNNSRVRCIAVDPRGQWLATGADDGRVRLWDLEIGRCAGVWDLNYGSAERDRSPVHSVGWCPNKSYSLLAAVTTGKATIIAPPQTSPGSSSATATTSFQHAIAGYQPAATTASQGSTSAPIAKWSRPSDTERSNGVAMHINFTGTAKQLTWHAKGDYFATVSPDGGSSSVLIHQLTRHRSQAPFKKASKGSNVQKVIFHPTKPHLFVATQRYIRIYDLSIQSLVKTLQPGLKWISSMDIHSQGDHLVVGSYDKRLCWFDLDLSTKPYKTLRYHSKAIRSVGFSKNYPIFNSTSDDGSIHLFHATVYQDFSTNPLIVPLKILKGHTLKDGLGVLDSVWVNGQPWIVTAGADGTAKLWTP